ncbi:MAG TPA: aminotransferase class I/II-fold pyridoxal phosphate-dependent enzyme, partial [Rhodospirillaceae bacterium]|nr:aminotransferase class I/II-fold pyridoxal phosphate-dependent enzyme [Rhodospirillaceae bacterium]
PGALAVAAAIDGGFDNVVVLHSLSKRSSVPGLRSGFLAGDARVIAGFAKLRAYAGAAIPLPLLAASIALWNDEAHVESNRALYRAKFDIAEDLLGGDPGFQRPPGGFFLWHRVGDGEAAALRLWREAGIRVLPGAYLARDQADGSNPGSAYIRVALVHDLETTRRGLSRLASVLTPAEAG